MRARLLLAAALLLAACKEADSVVVVTVSGPAGLAVRQLDVTTMNGTDTDALKFPDASAAKDLGLPASFALVVDRGRTGTVTIAIDAKDAGGSVVARATTTATLVVGGTANASATLVAVGEPATPTACSDYCAQLAEGCDAGFAKVFADSQTTCVKLCDELAWPAGTKNELTGNTLACRMANATKAVGEASACDAASYSGGNVCGSLCEVYCFMQAQICTKAGLPQFPDATTCMTACATFDQSGAFHATSGNTLQCRMYHLTAAALQDVNTHCPHTGALPTKFCQ